MDYILEGSSISCSSSLSWADGLPECQIKYNVIALYPSSNEYAGELIVAIKGLCNPLFQVTAGFINLKIYDGFNQKILVRSHSNLSKNQFSYTYPGPVIHVNNDITFSAERGTISANILITLDYPCALDLVLTPFTSGFVFIPTQISLSTGMVSQYFRVSVPSTVDDTKYVIN